jgi:hypothetical protein
MLHRWNNKCGQKSKWKWNTIILTTKSTINTLSTTINIITNIMLSITKNTTTTITILRALNKMKMKRIRAGQEQLERVINLTKRNNQITQYATVKMVSQKLTALKQKKLNHAWVMSHLKKVLHHQIAVKFSQYVQVKENQE